MSAYQSHVKFISKLILFLSTHVSSKLFILISLSYNMRNFFDVKSLIQEKADEKS